MRRWTPSFRTRIALFSAAVSGAVLLAFGCGVVVWLDHRRVAAMDREIRALAFRHPGWMNNRANYGRLAEAIAFIFGEDRPGALVLASLDVGGEVRFRSVGWPASIDPNSLPLELAEAPSGSGPVAGRAAELFTRAPRFVSVRSGGTWWRFGILGNERDRLVLGMDESAGRAELERFHLGFLLALPVAVAVIGLGGWWVGGQAVRPLRGIARAAEQVTARGLDQRIPLPSGDPEVDRLIAVLNGMMDRLETSFRQATRFSADASHELKTPLAVMQGELEQALQGVADGSPEQRVLASLLDETQRLKRIVRGLLLLAQADAGRLAMSPEPVDFSAELEQFLDDARIAAEPAGVEVRSTIAPGLSVHADRVLLRQAVTNLLDNALQYNRRGGWMSVEARGEAGGVEVRVVNTGPGIAEEDRAGVFERFRRGGSARERRREGLGLGLSLAREIVAAHRGVLELADSGVDRTEFRLWLPNDGRTHGEET